MLDYKNCEQITASLYLLHFTSWRRETDDKETKNGQDSFKEHYMLWRDIKPGDVIESSGFGMASLD